MFGDSNGQIKLRAKQKFKFLSATNYRFDDITPRSTLILIDSICANKLL